MNFGAQPQKYDNIPQQTPSINNINQQFLQQPAMNYSGCFNYSYSNAINYNSYGHQNYYNTIATSNSDSVNQAFRTNVAEKRKSKPLIVIDPFKNEVVDLHKISKSKNSSLIDEIQQSDNSHSLIPNLLSKIEIKDVDHEKVDDKQPPTVPNVSVQVTESIDIPKQISLFSISTPGSMKQSHSIPNKLDNLSEGKLIQQISSSSETDLHAKSNASLIELQKILNNQRKTYNRDSLIEIRKSERSLKLPFSLEKFECKEIIVSLSDSSKLLINQNIKRKIINIESPNSGSLSRITNGYLPPHLRLKEECSLNKHLENCRRNLKCILNKIAPQNFLLCINEMKSIIKSSDQQNVKIDDCIDCLIEEIFDKAVKEEAYSVTYANLCTQIAKFDDENESKWNFKSSLLNRCKKMFETPLQDQLKFVKEHWEKKIETESDEKLKNLYRSDIEEQIKKAQDKYFGNVRFIGELYVHDLLKPQIIHCCVTSLLEKTNDEDAMLSLCKLIETCGKKFDEKHRDKMSDYIKSMHDILEKEQLETRIRFRILDIIEMSERKWLLREIQSQKMVRPKTLEEVKKDNNEDKTITVSKFSSSKSQNRPNTKCNQNQAELRFKQQTRNQSIDLNSLSVGQYENYDLKPSSYGCWNGNKEKDSSEWKNVDGKKRTKNKYPQSGKQQLLGHNKSSPIRHTDESSAKMYGNSKFSVLLSQDDNNDNSLYTSESPIRYPSPCESKSEDDTVILDGDELLDNLLETKSLNVAAWCNQNKVSELICHWLDRIMEKNKKDRNLVGDQLANLVACDKLSKDILINGLTQFLDLIDDLITDIPKIWTCFAEFLERFIQNSDSYVEFYRTIFESRLPNTKICECILLILEYTNDRLGNEIVKDLVDKKLGSLIDLIGKREDIVTQLLKSNIYFWNNKFTDSFKSNLNSRLSNNIESVFELLDSQFTPTEMQTDECVYFLSHCLFSFICDLSSKSQVIDFLVKTHSVFIHIIGSNSKFEKQTLLALANCATYLQKKDFLLTIFQNLMNQIISKETLQHFIHNSVNLINKNDYKLIIEAINSTSDNDQR